MSGPGRRRGGGPAAGRRLRPPRGGGGPLPPQRPAGHRPRPAPGLDEPRPGARRAPRHLLLDRRDGRAPGGALPGLRPRVAPRPALRGARRLARARGGRLGPLHDRHPLACRRVDGGCGGRLPQRQAHGLRALPRPPAAHAPAPGAGAVPEGGRGGGVGAAAGARLARAARLGGEPHARGLPALHPGVARRAELREALLHPAPERLDQRPQRLLPGQRQAGGGAGHRAEPIPAGRRRAAPFPRSRRGRARPRPGRGRLRPPVQCRLARELAEAHFDARAVARGLLERALP